MMGGPASGRQPSPHGEELQLLLLWEETLLLLLLLQLVLLRPVASMGPDVFATSHRSETTIGARASRGPSPPAIEAKVTHRKSAQRTS